MGEETCKFTRCRRATMWWVRHARPPHGGGGGSRPCMCEGAPCIHVDLIQLGKYPPGFSGIGMAMQAPMSMQRLHASMLTYLP